MKLNKKVMFKQVILIKVSCGTFQFDHYEEYRENVVVTTNLLLNVLQVKQTLLDNSYANNEILEVINLHNELPQIIVNTNSTKII